MTLVGKIRKWLREDVKGIERSYFLRSIFGSFFILLGIVGIVFPILPGFTFFVIGLMFFLGVKPVMNFILGVFPKKWRERAIRKFEKWGFKD